MPERVTGVAHDAAAARAVMGPCSTGLGAAKAPEMADATTAAKIPFMLATGSEQLPGCVDVELLGATEPLISSTASG